MVQPLRESRDRYEELKQIDDAMNEVNSKHVCDKCLVSEIIISNLFYYALFFQVQKKKSENLTMGGKKK